MLLILLFVKYIEFCYLKITILPFVRRNHCRTRFQRLWFELISLVRKTGLVRNTKSALWLLNPPLIKGFILDSDPHREDLITQPTFFGRTTRNLTQWLKTERTLNLLIGGLTCHPIVRCLLFPKHNPGKLRWCIDSHTLHRVWPNVNPSGLPYYLQFITDTDLSIGIIFLDRLPANLSLLPWVKDIYGCRKRSWIFVYILCENQEFLENRAVLLFHWCLTVVNVIYNVKLPQFICLFIIMI